MTGGPSVAVVLAGEAGVRAGAVDAWLPDGAARQVVDEASAVVGRDVATWWRDPLTLSCDTTAAHVEVVASSGRSAVHRAQVRTTSSAREPSHRSMPA